MRCLFKAENLILVPENDVERKAAAEWKAEKAGHVLIVAENSGEGLSLRDLGRVEDACREPINVTSRHPDPAIQLLSNFAATPFELDGVSYPSVESFWQSLKFAKGAERRHVASLAGPAARRAGEDKPYDATIGCGGEVISVGTFAHWALMKRACWAKFTQHEEARAALLATNDRPLTHRVRNDSRTIPGAIMADIWMAIRHKIRESAPTFSKPRSAE